MNTHHFRNNFTKAFTLVELLAIIAALALLSCLFVPAFARAKPKSTIAQCLSNKKQMQMAEALYTADNNDFLVTSSFAGLGGWLGNVPNCDWFNSDANTNPAPYKATAFGAYFGNDIRAYRCPNDLLPSQNGLRIRAVSMNGQVGIAAAQNSNPPYKVFNKISDFHNTSQIWIFCDEAIWCMNDGWLDVSFQLAEFPDAPAAYDAGGNCFSFADGHAQYQKWTGHHQASPEAPTGILGVVYQTGVIRSGGTVTAASLTDPDWLWLKLHGAQPN